MGCPLKSDKGKADYKKYPQLLKARIKAQEAYLKKQKSGKGLALFGNAYNATFFQLFCDNIEEYKLKMSVDLWGGQLDTKEFLQQYFNIKF